MLSQYKHVFTHYGLSKIQNQSGGGRGARGAGASPVAVSPSSDDGPRREGDPCPRVEGGDPISPVEGGGGAPVEGGAEFRFTQTNVRAVSVPH